MRFFLLLFILSTFACKSEDPITSIKVNLAGTGFDEIIAFNIVDDLTFDLSGQVDSFQLDINQEIILDLNFGWNHSYIHVKPGDQILVDTISTEPIRLGVINQISKENQYLKSFTEIKREIEDSYMVSEVTKLPVDSFLMEIRKKNVPFDELLSEINEDVELGDFFKSAMNKRLIGLKTNDLSYYKGFYNRHFDKEPELPENYYSDFESENMSDPTFLLFDEGRQVLSFYHSRDLDYQEYPSLNDFYKASIESAKLLYGDSQVAAFCNQELLANMINFGGGLDGAQELIAEFRNFSKGVYLNNKLDKTIEPWKDLISGKAAPDFKAMTREGKAVKLSELKGKKVYVDVWATWCGPCIAEIPSLKKLESELHDENIAFVSVSIDEEKDAEKWKNYIQDKALTGMQLMAEGAWKSDVATAYNIKGIPRFLLIDDKGMIVSANAPRPSSDNIKETLLN